MRNLARIGGLVVFDCMNGMLENFDPKQKLEQGGIVMISGSKFFRGPLNTEAVLVPPHLMKRLERVNTNKFKLPSFLNQYFGKNEIPRQLKGCRSLIKDNQNPGLALRWVAAFTQM